MSLYRIPKHRYRAASLLALLAVMAQLWMVQLSHQHLAAQVSNWLQWGEVCSTHSPDAPAPDDTGHPMGMGGMDCPVCAVAGTGMAPVSAPAVVALFAAPASSAPAWLRAARLPAFERGVRPPAQAPPAALS